MESKTTEKFRALLSAAPQSIQLKAKACYVLWFQNPDHPSLRFKKVHQTLPIYSVRIDLKLARCRYFTKRYIDLVLGRLAPRL